MKLLRILQTGEYERLGSSKTRKADVRVISATNADLLALISEGGFREDLYYRLNLIEIHVPPLSARREDILPLAQHFLPEGSVFTAAAERSLLSYDWPGNVRELQNHVQRASILARGDKISPELLDLADSPAQLSGTRDAGPAREEIEEALARADGNVSRAARQLGLSRQALYRRMDKR
jgi:DNA-binding NtrC family response regulator